MIQLSLKGQIMTHIQTFRSILVWFLFFSAASLSASDDWKHYFYKGDYISAEELLIPLADGKNVEAQIALATIYQKGGEVSKNEGKAIYYFLAAADSGSAIAQHNLGLIFYYGIGIKSSKKSALKWFSASAEQGYLESKIYVEKLSTETQVLEINATKNIDSALPDLFTKHLSSAKEGNATSQYIVSQYYSKGSGVEKNTTLGMKYLKASSDQNYSSAQLALGLAYLNGIDIEVNYDKALELLTRYCEKNENDENASEAIYTIISNDLARRYDTLEALKHLKALAAYGIPAAQFRIAEMLFVEKKYDQAVLTYTKAMDGGHVQAYMKLAQIYDKGINGEKKNKKEALRLYIEGSKLKEPEAILHIGLAFETGEGLSQNNTRALASYYYAISLHKKPFHEADMLVAKILKHMTSKEVSAAYLMLDHLKKEGTAVTFVKFFPR